MTKQTTSSHGKLKKDGTSRTSVPTRFKTYWQASRWHKAWIVIAVALLAWVGVMYGIARWYISAQDPSKQVIGTSFIPAYAESLGLDAQKTMDALINDLGVKHFRLVSYWNQLEAEQGKYDFSLLDWQFAKAEEADAKVTLSVGLRQPRWPECHIPEWAKHTPQEQWQPQLEAFMTAVVNRYKNSPALASYQVENEYFLKGFGRCVDFVGEEAAFDRARLISEYNLVKKLDPHHKAIIARSNNALGWPVGDPKPDEYGISIYKRVWDAQVTKRYLEYPFPAWYYAFVAGWEKIFTGRDLIAHEVQAEAWPPNHQSIQETSLEEQNKSFNAERFTDRVEYARATGLHEVYLWGSEYWYYRKVILQDDSLWKVAQTTFTNKQ
jgi:hypothetical protein